MCRFSAPDVHAGGHMKAPLSRATEPVYTLFRIVVGLLFTFHGAQKVFGAFGGHAQPVMTRLWAAGVIELVCGLLVAIGLLTWIAALIASGEMVAAYYIAHFPKGLWPIQNGGEPAVLYCVAFLFIAARGSGVFSVDR
jgi:putative oxidoreductase